jgi:hypothetical protein
MEDGAGGACVANALTGLVPRDRARGVADHHHGGVALEHRLRRFNAIVVALNILNRVEIHVLILQCVREFVPDDGLAFDTGTAFDHKQRLAFGVVEPDNLFSE